VTYTASILFDGSEILVTYEIKFEKIPNTNSYRIISIEVIESDEHQKCIEEDFCAVLGCGNKPVVGPTQTNSTHISVLNVKNISTSEVVTSVEKYTIYQHPSTGKFYWLFESGKVVDAETKKIVSHNGGLKWLTQFFSGSVVTVNQGEFQVYSYELTGE